MPGSDRDHITSQPCRQSLLVENGCRIGMVPPEEYLQDLAIFGVNRSEASLFFSLSRAAGEGWGEGLKTDTDG